MRLQSFALAGLCQIFLFNAEALKEHVEVPAFLVDSEDTTKTSYQNTATGLRQAPSKACFKGTACSKKGDEGLMLLQTRHVTAQRAQSQLPKEQSGLVQITIRETRPALGKQPQSMVTLWPKPEWTNTGPQLLQVSDGEPTSVSLDRMVWVIITGGAEHFGQNFADRVIPSAETWLAGAPPGTVYAVFGRSQGAMNALGKASCTKLAALAAGFDEYSCPTAGVEIRAVVTPCADDQARYDLGPCCKIDNILPVLADAGRLANADWLYVADDDMYVHTPSATRLLGSIDHGQPYALNGDGNLDGPKVAEWNKLISSCNGRVPQGFYYTIISRGLWELLLPSIRENEGLARVCNTTRGSYDTTAGLFFWRHGAGFLPTQDYTIRCDADFWVLCHRYGEKNPGCVPANSWRPNVFNHGVRTAKDFPIFHNLFGTDVPFQMPKHKLEVQSLMRKYDGKKDTCAQYLLQPEGAS